MKRSYLIALIIGAVFIVWIGLGLIFGNDDSQTAQKDGSAGAQEELVGVRVIKLTAQPKRTSIVIRGRTEAKRAVKVRAETAGNIADLPVEKGQFVKKGDTLCKISVNARQARLDEARALVQQRRLEYDAARKLAAKGYRSETQAAGTKAAYDASKAQLKQMEVELGNTNIVAPFDGIFDDRDVEIGDFLAVGQPCGLMVQLDPLKVTGQVAEDKVSNLQVGTTGMARLVTGEKVEGKIIFVAKTADEATRTFRVEMEVPNPDRKMRSGVTAEIVVPSQPVMAHLVPSSVISLNDQGVIGVRTVDNDDRVQFYEAKLVDDTPEGLWVSGLPETVRLITVGQDYVTKGQKVRVELDSKSGASS
ncbi:efflux RND transporter periplasmic adaptor subunit [Parvibaculum sp. MBR-TMA-1.3b-4.2]|jgi:multidrug efflux system membrane fusion protein